MDPHPSQQQAGLQRAVWRQQQEVAKPKARFKPTLPEKSGVDGCYTIYFCPFSKQWIGSCDSKDQFYKANFVKNNCRKNAANFDALF